MSYDITAPISLINTASGDIIDFQAKLNQNSIRNFVTNAVGDIVYCSALSGADTVMSALPIGSSNQILQVTGSLPSWNSINLASLFSVGPIDPVSNIDGLTITASSIYLHSPSLTNQGVVFGITSSNSTTALGYNNTATNVLTTSNSTFLGAQTDATSSGLFNATAIGYNAIVRGSNNIQLGNANALISSTYSTWSQVQSVISLTTSSTITAANLLNNIFVVNTSNIIGITLPTAAQLVAAAPGVIVGSTIKTTFIVTSSSSTPGFFAGSGITINDPIVLTPGTKQEIIFRFTNVGSGTEAVTLYSGNGQVGSTTVTVAGSVGAPINGAMFGTVQEAVNAPSTIQGGAQTILIIGNVTESTSPNFKIGINYNIFMNGFTWTFNTGVRFGTGATDTSIYLYGTGPSSEITINSSGTTWINLGTNTVVQFNNVAVTNPITQANSWIASGQNTMIYSNGTTFNLNGTNSGFSNPKPLSEFNSTTFNGTGGSASRFITNVSGQVFVRGAIISGTLQAGNVNHLDLASGSVIDGLDTTVSGVRVRACQMEHLRSTSGLAVTAIMDNGNYCTISDSFVYDIQPGTSDCFITNCRIDNTISINSSGATIENLNINNCRIAETQNAITFSSSGTITNLIINNTNMAGRINNNMRIVNLSMSNCVYGTLGNTAQSIFGSVNTWSNISISNTIFNPTMSVQRCPFGIFTGCTFQAAGVVSTTPQFECTSSAVGLKLIGNTFAGSTTLNVDIGAPNAIVMGNTENGTGLGVGFNLSVGNIIFKSNYCTKQLGVPNNGSRYVIADNYFSSSGEWILTNSVVSGNVMLEDINFGGASAGVITTGNVCLGSMLISDTSGTQVRNLINCNYALGGIFIRGPRNIVSNNFISTSGIIFATNSSGQAGNNILMGNFVNTPAAINLNNTGSGANVNIAMGNRITSTSGIFGEIATDLLTTTSGVYNWND